MELTSHDLIEIMRTLTPHERQADEACLNSKRTDKAGAVLRWIRRRLKKRVRSKKR